MTAIKKFDGSNRKATRRSRWELKHKLEPCISVFTPPITRPSNSRQKLFVAKPAGQNLPANQFHSRTVHETLRAIQLSNSPVPIIESHNMKLLTLNFLTCAIKTCKTNPASFPLHPRDAELEIVEADVNLAFLKNILPRLMWNELRGICSEVCETLKFYN